MSKIIIVTISVLHFCSIVFSQNKQAPKLVVGIVVDQMCYEYLYRYQSKFSKNGFLKLMNQGSHFRNTQYNYVPTYTGPGHASIYTGTTPENHEIIANEWFDRNTGKTIRCVDDTTVVGVGTTSEEGKCSPKNLKANTITDQLKLTYPTAKVISVSLKARSAILPGGHLSDGSYWFDSKSGNFVTSSFFKKEIPFWVANFNNRKFPDSSLTKTWEPFLNLEDYTESGADNSPYETILKGKKTPTFPYNLSEMCAGIPNYSLFTLTPFANTYLTNFAIESIYNEMLGQDNQTDFLCVSYSTPDIAGHEFGPYSVEMEDMYIRLDLELAHLIKKLEEKVGKNQFLLFLTADHAVVPVPQYLIDKNLPGGYVFLEDNLLQLDADVKANFGSDLIVAEENNSIYLDYETIDLLKIEKQKVEEFIADKIAQWEGVKAVYTSEQIKNSSDEKSWKHMVKLGYVPRKSGDVIFILEPGFLPKSKDSEKARKGTSHGSAFNYDTHVPLIWYGKNCKKQEVFRRINITDITATLTHILSLQKPNTTTGEPILELLIK